jgi:uncharacterized phage-associated protein
MIRTYQRDRLLGAIAYFAKNTKYCGKTKLMKLLYFLDFIHFRQTGKSVTGLEYYAWQMGPVPRSLFEELSEIKGDMAKEIKIDKIGNFQKIIAKKAFNGDCFTPRQIKLLEKVAFIFKEAKADDMIEVTHLKNQPWDQTLKQKGEYSKIDYLLAIDGSKDCIGEDDASEAIEEMSEMYRIFGTL